MNPPSRSSFLCRLFGNYYFTALLTLVYGLVFAYTVYFGITHPFYNWDQLGYVGSITYWANPDPAVAFEKTKDVMRANIPGWIYDLDFQNPLVVNSVAFRQQLIMYQLKPLYNGLSWLVHQFGVNLPLSTVVVSSLSVGGMGAILYAWRPRYMSRNVWLASILALMFLFPWPMETLARFSTPDALCTFAVVAMAYCLMFSKRTLLFCLCCLLCVLARPDTLIICTLFTLYSMVTPCHRQVKLPKWQGVGVLALMLVIYMIVGKLAGNLGIERWFIYSFIHKTPFPADDTDHLTFNMYYGVVSYWLVYFLKSPRTICMLVLTLVALVGYYFKRERGNQFTLHIMCLTWASLWARFFLYPGVDERYYFMYFIIIVFCAGELIAPYIGAFWRAFKTAHKEALSNSPPVG